MGKWRLVWTKQGTKANPLQQALAKQVANWQIITEDGQLENRVRLPGGLTVRAIASCEPDSPTRTGVEINSVVLQAGPLKVPIPVKTDSRGFVDYLWLGVCGLAGWLGGEHGWAARGMAPLLESLTPP